MKLVIQIPCLNEEATLPQVLLELPRDVDGFDEVEWLLIDDGSSDRTVEVGRAHGVDHVVRLTNNMVVGDRQVKDVEHFSASKKSLQRLGSWVVRRASGTAVPDTTSGFRAYNREAALQLQVVSNYTYTLESLIQAGKMLVAVEHVPIQSNPETRESRLVDSTPAYVRRNALAVFRAYVLYEPLRVFTIVACVFGVAALIAWMPFVLDWILNGDRSGHVQSLILGAVLALTAVQMFGLGVVGDAIAGQRVIAQRTFERVRRLELEAGIEPSHYEAAQADVRAPVEDGRGSLDQARANHRSEVGG
jgi:hypothetical protein